MKIIQINKDIQDLHAIEHDINTRFPTFQFKDGLKPYDLSNCSVRVYGVNSLVNSFFNNLEVVNAKQGIAKLELTDTMLVKGTTKMQFVIMPNSGGQLKTKIFNLVNGESLVDSDALEGSNEYKAFEEALSTLQQFESKVSENEKNINLNKGKISASEQKISTLESKQTEFDNFKTETTSFLNLLTSTTEDHGINFEIPIKSGENVKVECFRKYIGQGETAIITPSFVSRIRAISATPHTGGTAEVGVENDRTSCKVRHNGSNGMNIMIILIGN